jgi:GNAT superfamily N-acetyltransferase
MAEPILIRRGLPEDFDRWLPLWDGYNEFYGRTGPTALPRTITDTTWRRFFEADEPMHALIAELQGELVGFAHYLFHRSTTSVAPACYLRDLYTSAEMRGKGVATALIDRVRDEARCAGSPNIYWQTHETNQVARKLYDTIAERSGFIVYQKSV